MKIRKLFRVTHRDLGYLFFGMSIIYGLSGIALNHIKDWNPNYIVETQEVESELTPEFGLDEEHILSFLASVNEEENYKKHYYPATNTLKIFIKNGSIMVNTKTGDAFIEKIKRRPIFYEFNYLHYNHAKKLWLWFADLFAISLIWLAISGLFMIKGKKGITGRGAWLTTIGIIIPLILYMLYI